MFIKVRVYCINKSDIESVKRGNLLEEIVNTEQISSLEQTTYLDSKLDSLNYPVRKLRFANGNYFLLEEKSGNILENYLILTDYINELKNK